mmetsp:Transcript_60820/g.121908  ORF Transcript_60820/g.121908 Transcript_60820/m.121908 type:complete len:257 (+) Transcript_60820:66-836(+)
MFALNMSTPVGRLPLYGSARASSSILDTCAPTVNLSWASLMQAAPLLAFQSSFSALPMVAASVAPSVFTPRATVDKSVVSGGSATSSPTSGETKSLGPPEFAPMTGVLQAMHSTKTKPKGSLKDGKHPRFATVYISASWSCPLAPIKKVLLSPSSSQSFFSLASSSSGPVPAQRRQRSSNSVWRVAMAVRRAAWRFHSAALPTKTTIFLYFAQSASEGAAGQRIVRVCSTNTSAKLFSRGLNFSTLMPLGATMTRS